MLYKHQQQAIKEAIAAKGNFAFFHEPGLGKTRSCLEVFAHYRKEDTNLKLFVVCPLSLINAAWGTDIKKFTEFSYIPFKELKNKAIPDITSINYESFISKKNLPKIKTLLEKYNFMCVLDESCRLQNNKSITTKTFIKMKDLFKYRIVCTGTPMPNIESELWGQISFINSNIFNKSFYSFRNEYFHLERDGQVFSGFVGGNARSLLSSGWKYSISDTKRKSLMEAIRKHSSWVKKKDALDLPLKITETREVSLSPKESKVYNEMERDLITEVEGESVIASVALAKYMKLRQVASGFIYTSPGEAVVIGNSKLKELNSALDEIGNRQVIIWVQFKEEARQISNLLKKKKKTCSLLTGEQKDKDVAISEFQSGNTQYLIAHPRTAAHGLTFVNCSIAIYYSLDYSYKYHIQSKDRIHRIGQTESCLYIYLVVPGSIEEEIINVLDGKQKLQDIVENIIKKGRNVRTKTKTQGVGIS